MVMLYQHSSLSHLPSDEELVRHARTGNKRATEQLLTKYRTLVECKAHSYFLLGADHDDVVQEGMIGLYKAIRDYRDDRLSRFRAFADLCVTRQIVTAVKSATRHKHVPLNAYISLQHTATGDAEPDLMLIDALPDPRSKDAFGCLLFSNESHNEAHICLDAVRPILSQLEASVLDCFLLGKTYREMSHELACRPKAIDNALQRVKRKISQTLFCE
jgi:RNA polymerase sporulation-specific sigma factor